MLFRFITLAAAILALGGGLAACKNAPGADGRYANHDHGDYRPP